MITDQQLIECALREAHERFPLHPDGKTGPRSDVFHHERGSWVQCTIGELRSQLAMVEYLEKCTWTHMEEERIALVKGFYDRINPS